jgi:hypothetical protein
MQDTTSPIFMYIGGRLRSPFNKPAGGGSVANDTLVGAIYNILIEDVRVSHALRPVRETTHLRHFMLKSSPSTNYLPRQARDKDTKR